MGRDGLKKKYEMELGRKFDKDDLKDLAMTNQDWIDVMAKVFEEFDLGELNLREQGTIEELVNVESGERIDIRCASDNLITFVLKSPLFKKEVKPAGKAIETWHLGEQLFGSGGDRVDLERFSVTMTVRVPFGMMADEREPRLLKTELDKMDRVAEAVIEGFRQKIREKLLGSEIKEVNMRADARIVFSGESSVTMSPRDYEQLCSCPIK